MGEAYGQFIATVRQKEVCSGDAAKRDAQAVLATLAERIAPGEARDLAAVLPPGLGPCLHTATPAEPFDIDEFLRGVTGREQADVAQAEHHARAVFAALGRTVPTSEIHDLVSELPGDFAPLIAEPEGRFLEHMPANAFVQRVADRAGLNEDGARRAIDAVLETLAGRITGGEVDDRVALLPVQLHPALERGKAASGGQAPRMSLEQFLPRVAHREGITRDEAREHAAAVSATLREAIPQRDLLDVTAQLPVEYAAIEALPSPPQRSRTT